MSEFKEFEENKTDNSAIGLSLILSSIFVFGSVLFAFILYRSTVSATINEKQITDIPMERQKLISYEESNLNALRFINKSEGVVQIPIDLAMKRVIKDYE